MVPIPAGLPPIDPATFNQQQTNQITNNQPQFMDTLKQTLQQAQSIQSEADQKVSALVTGQGGDVQSAMIAAEKANLSFQLVMEVRNKIVQAYQDVYNMQF
ncbi:MAG TPA: flagellar hook-basal body complex protein FliE [Terriglobia bacterium]|nr:flagellar hook-basal body complex protein FliE [Terriglobia bacterium]HEX5481331.1 flagellar hook-basal body complex protein FliE [Terriglobia bacterium]